MSSSSANTFAHHYLTRLLLLFLLWLALLTLCSSSGDENRALLEDSPGEATVDTPKNTAINVPANAEATKNEAPAISNEIPGAKGEAVGVIGELPTAGGGAPAVEGVIPGKQGEALAAQGQAKTAQGEAAVAKEEAAIIGEAVGVIGEVPAAGGGAPAVGVIPGMQGEALTAQGEVAAAKGEAAAAKGEEVETKAEILKSNFLEACFEVPQTICLTTSHVIMPSSVPDHLAAYWSFDKRYAVDDSRNGNHLHPGLRAGPPVFGPGASAYLHPDSHSAAQVISPKLESDSFTLSLWLYLLTDSTGDERPFLSRGGNFVVALGPTNRTLVVNSGSSNVYSTAIILLKRWTHIAVSYSPTSISLYVNGMWDRTSPIDGGPVGVSAISLGKQSKTSPSSSIEGYIDEVKIFSKELPTAEIASLTIPQLTGIADPNQVKLGCQQCDENKAKNPSTCAGDYHLCTNEELMRFGFRIARVQGWLIGITGVWQSDQLPPQDVEGKEAAKAEEMDKRLALCCYGSAKCVEAEAKMAQLFLQ